jgi:hypothetical protein
MYWEIDAQTPDMMEKALMKLESQLLNKGAYDDVKVIRTSVSKSIHQYTCNCKLAVMFLLSTVNLY